MKTRRTALSRIELLVVIVIIVLVPSILMASLEAARELAKIPVCANQLRQLGLAVSLYAESYDGRMPWWGYDKATAEDPYAGNEEMHPYVAYRRDKIAWIDPITGKLKPMRLACLYEAGVITDPRIFYCPAMRQPMFMFESYNDPPPWGRLPQYYNVISGSNQWVRVGYTYYPTDPNDPKVPGTDAPSRTARRFDGLDPNIPYMTDIIWHKSYVPHNIQDTLGVNALFKDGHVVYCDDQSVFDDPVWDDLEAPLYEPQWRVYYYTIFKLIGQSCGPTE